MCRTRDRRVKTRARIRVSGSRHPSQRQPTSESAAADIRVGGMSAFAFESGAAPSGAHLEIRRAAAGEQRRCSRVALQTRRAADTLRHLEIRRECASTRGTR